MPEVKDIAVTLTAVFNEFIVAHCGTNPDAGWRQENSCQMIEAVVNADVDAAVEAGQDMKKYVLSEAAQHIIAKVVNPSAFRQVLERTERATPVNGCKTILREMPKEQKRKTSLNIGL